MTKDLKLFVVIKGDNTQYELTDYSYKDSVSVFDKQTGVHMDFDWKMVKGVFSKNPRILE